MGGIYVEPGTQGGTNWYPPSYSPRTGLFYVAVWDNYGGRSSKFPVPPMGGGAALHGRDGAAGLRSACRAPEAAACPCHSGRKNEGYGAIRALDPKTGEKKWDFKMVNYTESGVLSTGGDLVFGGGQDGNFVALDARTGERLWNVFLGGPNASGPISYAVNGKQYVIGTGMGTMYAFALPD